MSQKILLPSGFQKLKLLFNSTFINAKRFANNTLHNKICVFINIEADISSAKSIFIHIDKKFTKVYLLLYKLS